MRGLERTLENGTIATWRARRDAPCEVFFSAPRFRPSLPVSVVQKKAQTVRLLLLDRLLRTRTLGVKDLALAFGISEASVKRDIAQLRALAGKERIEYVKDRGYRYAGARRVACEPDVEAAAPEAGEWLSSRGLHAVVRAHNEFDELARDDTTRYREDFRAVATYLARILKRVAGTREAAEVFSVMPDLCRSVIDDAIFGTVEEAVVTECCLALTYFSNARSTQTRRTVTPISLMHNRERWYLLAYCHAAKDFRIFALDCVLAAELAPGFETAKVDRRKAGRVMANRLSTFAGESDQCCRLQFTSVAARYVGNYRWHQRQTVELLAGGELIVSFPYTVGPELEGMILRWGAECVVLEPPELRKSLARRLQQTLSHYAPEARDAKEEPDHGR